MIRQSARKTVVLLLALLLCSTMLARADSIDDIINRIIDADYYKLLEKMKEEYHHLRDFDGGFNVGGYKPLPGYQCQHDRLHQENVKSPREAHEEARLMGRDIDHTKSARSVQEAAATGGLGNIRIVFNTDRLTQDDYYGCFNTSTSVTVDTITGYTNTACTGSNSPCVFKCTTDYVITAGLRNLIINSLISTIQTTLSTAIQLEQVQGNLVLAAQNVQLNSYCAIGYPYTTAMTTTGIPNADYYVFVTARPTSDYNVIASARACVYDYDTSKQVYTRPIAGTINFNPSYFTGFVSNPSGLTYREYVRVGLHEMNHALGFSNNFYSSYLNSDGEPYSNPSPSIVTSGTTPAGTAYTYTRKGISTPSVVAFAQAHFACTTLSYVELEDSGGAGTASSHWEKRVAGEELMLGYVQPMFPLTNLTLSLLQDTGWYQIDFGISEQLYWGKNLGCDFTKQCTPTTWQYPGYFCSQVYPSYTPGCSATRAAKGVCFAYDYGSDLSYPYQHYSNPQLGGIDNVADYCPFYDASPKNGYVYCQDESQTPLASIGEVYGNSSRCFEYSASSGANQGCFQQRCLGENYQILVNGQWNTCANAGDSFTVGGVTVVCPDYYYPCLPVGVPVPPKTVSASSSVIINLYSILFITTLSLILLFI